MSSASLNTSTPAALLKSDLLSRPAVKPLDRSLSFAVLAGGVLLLLVAGASVWQAARNTEALGVAQLTRARRTLATDVLATTTSAESAQRGYLLTLNADYLAPLDRAERELPGLIKNGLAMWQDDPRMGLLDQAATAKMAELRQTAALAQGGNLPAAMAIVKSNAGFTDMEVIRHVTDQLTREQDSNLIDQVSRVTRGSRLLVAIDVAGLVMVFALGGLIALSLRNYMATLRSAQTEAAAAQEALERNNRHLDETVRHRTAALTEANEEIQRFAYIVSHDLRAPLVNIMGFTSELEQATAILSHHALAGDASPDLREAAEEDIPEALRFIKSSTGKMDRLINAILKLSREGRRVLAPEPLDMRALLGGLVETMRHQAESKDAQVSLGTLPDLVGDRLAVEQVFGNVVENALKYLKPGRPGEVRVQGRPDGRMVRYEVSDNGRGIAARDYERVFELFRRAGDQTVPGEGIGLAHVRALVRRLGGSIDCVSEVDIGSTFVIKLPAVASYEREGSV